MAPKRKARAVLKKTKKVVEETVQVTIIDDGEKAVEIAMEEGMEIGKEARDEVTRTTVIVGGDGETEEMGEGQEKRVEIPTVSQNLEEPVLVTPRKEAEKKGEKEWGVRETEKERRPEVRGEREKERAEAAGADTGEGGKGGMEVETQDEATKAEAERRDETEKGDETAEPEEGLVKTPEKQEVGRATMRDGGGETNNRKRRKKRRGVGIGGGEPEQYKRYVYKVLKLVHPGLGISSAAMEVLNAYMNDMFERLADEAARLSRYTERKTL